VATRVILKELLFTPTFRHHVAQRIMNPRESEFQKKKKLGQGSYGVVWLVQQRSDGAQFAMKEISLRQQNLQQVMKEVETMVKLPPHRNVLQLHDYWMSEDREDLWLLLEYCSEGSLLQFLVHSARLDDAALWDLSGQLLQALLVFEQHRIVHNDIKPENIFVVEGGIPKIGDLGMARFTSAGSVLTKKPGGTPLFQSPEVLSKENGADGRPLCFPEYAACEISYQSDIYSLGAVLWSMVMRRNPDRPGGAFPLTPAHVPDSRLRELVNDMLQPDPAKRHRASHLVLRFTKTFTETVPSKVRTALLSLSALTPQTLRVKSTTHLCEPQQAAQPAPPGSLSQAENLFQEGRRLNDQQRFSDAAKSWGQAVLLQHVASHAFLSNMLFDGRPDVPKDEKRAFELASAGASMGCAHSKGALGRCLIAGAGVAKDAGKGLALGRESAAAGSCFGQYVVGWCHSNGLGVAQDDAEAVRHWRLAAAQGHLHSLYNLGVLFAKGQGVAQDNAEAVRFWRLAAAQGHAQAQVNLGFMFQHGQGVAQDYAEAARLYQLPAAQGNAEVQFYLGDMFANGQGVAQNNAEAVRLWRLAAAQGHAQAQLQLGTMYTDGLGVAQDYAEAVRLFRLGAARGEAPAQYNLGIMFANGQGVAQDDAEAVRLYRLAAAQGNALAQLNMGFMLDHGRGVARNEAEAIRWIRLAAAQGQAEANAILRQLGA
jgi:TPR repeat protein